MDMVSGAFSGNLENLVKENKISENRSMRRFVTSCA